MMKFLMGLFLVWFLFMAICAVCKNQNERLDLLEKKIDKLIEFMNIKEEPKC